MISDPNHHLWNYRVVVKSVNVDWRCNEGVGRVHVGVVVNGDRGRSGMVKGDLHYMVWLKTGIAC